jgi:F420-non-reducing hydrogenase iron-sulfur subunit
MCTGRIDLELVLRAFFAGADAVFIGGCRLNECNYATQGNYDALNMVLLCRRILEHLGLAPARLRIEFMSSGEGTLFAEVMNGFSEQARGLGPLGRGEGIDEVQLRTKLNEIIRLVPYIKIIMGEKLRARLQDPTEYEKLFTLDEVDRLFAEVVSYYIDPPACQACGICVRRCPAAAIAGGRDLVHVIDQEKCIKCGTCLRVCPGRFAAVRKIIAAPVPQPLPEHSRSIVRK